MWLTPVLPVVLYTGQEHWDASRQLSDLFDVPEAWRPWLPSWPMPLWDLSDHGAEDLLASREPWWQTLAVARAERASEEEFYKVFTDVLGRLVPLAAESRVRWEDLVNQVLYWARYRRPRSEHARLKEAALASVHAADLKREIQTMSELLEKNYEQELYERFLAQGLAQGEAKGRAEGEAKALRSVIQKQLRQRFTEVPDTVLQRIAAADVGKLEAAIDQVLSIQSPDDLTL